jgi:hypothetical protein
MGTRDCPPMAQVARVLLTVILSVMFSSLPGGLITSCSDDDTTGPKDVLGPWPASEDSLIALFREAYTGKDLAAYLSLLDDGYVFQFQPADIDHLGLTSSYLDRAAEEDIATNMFSGQPAPGGQPAIGEIRWPVLEGVGSWEDSYNPHHSGCQRRVFNILMEIDRPGDITLIIGGQQDFYVAPCDTILPDGSAATAWRLQGQADLSYSIPKGTESPTWGWVKATYRTP